MRPTETPPPDEVRLLSDAEVPDFLEAHEVALLAFVDSGDAASARLRERVASLVARLMRPDKLGAAAVDIAHHPLVAQALQVPSVPTLVVFVHAEMRDRISGLPPESVLEETVRAHLS